MDIRRRAPRVVPTDMSNVAETNASRNLTLGVLATQSDHIGSATAFLASNQARWVNATPCKSMRVKALIDI